MKFKTYIAFVLFLLMGQSAQSCINEYRALLNGDITYEDGFNAVPMPRIDLNNKKYLLKQLGEAERRYQKSRTIEDYSDYGSMLIYTGNHLKAKSIYLEIEKKSPGRYQTAANLGTTYELLGQNDSALYWIKKSVEIFPNSHGGSEWIHVKILEAKVKANGDENYLRTHSILSLDFGNEEIPENKHKLNVRELNKQLYFQLIERMSFIKPKDPVIAQLLFDLGNTTALTTDATGGLQVYRVAQEYGYSSELFTKRKEHFEDLQFWADFRNNTSQWMSDHKRLTVLIAVLVFIAGILVIRFLFKRIRKMVYKKRKSQDTLKAITILFLLMSQIIFSQEYSKQIGVSSCVCDSNRLDSVVTLTRFFYQNGKPSSETRINLKADCSIRDTSILKFDTLGRIIASSSSSNISTNYSYDSLGNFNESITNIDGKPFTHKKEIIRKNNQLVSVKTYYDGKLISISEVKKRKEIISNIDGKKRDIIRYNKTHHIRYFKSTQTTYDNEKLVITMKNKFNSNDDITKSVLKTNGQNQEITTTTYQNNKELKEVRMFCAEKYLITTMYYYE